MKSPRRHPNAMASLRSAAVFLDRDGTLIEEDVLIARPEQLRLIPGADEAIRLLRAAGFRIVIVTNQSAVGRGWLSEASLARIHAALGELLAARGAPLDAIYSCTDLPDEAAEARAPDGRRKPGAGMLLEAARDLELDLSRSWIIGDQIRDAVAGRRAGCRGALLVRTGRAPLGEDAAHASDGLFSDLATAARHILDVERTADEISPPSPS